MFNKNCFVCGMISLAIPVGLLLIAYIRFTLYQPEPPYEGLAGTYWKLEAIWVKDTNLFLPPFMPPAYGNQTLNFKGATWLIGDDGCNSFSGEAYIPSFKEKLLELWRGYTINQFDHGYQVWPDGRFVYKGGISRLIYCSHPDYDLMAPGQKFLQALRPAERYEVRTTPLELIIPDTQQRVLLDKQLWLYYIDSDTWEAKALVFGPFSDTP